MAEAYAEIGDFEKATQLGKQALEYAGPDFVRREEFQVKIRLFEKNTPYRFKSK